MHMRVYIPCIYIYIEYIRIITTLLMVRHAFVRSDSQNAFAEKDRMQVEENFFYILTRMTLSMRSFVRGTATASSEVMNAGTETH